MHKTNKTAKRLRKATGTRGPGNGAATSVNSGNGANDVSGAVRDVPARPSGFDLTVRKPADVAALRLAAVVQSSHDAIVAKDLNGIISDWNESAERIFGYTANEIVGKSILTIIPKDRQDEETEILRKIRRGESINHHETVRRRKDGDLIDVSLTISPIKDRDGEIIGVSKIARDITEQKRTQRRLIEQARLLELASDAIIVRDVHDRVQYWNKGAQETYGYTREEALGKVTHVLLKTEHPEALAKILRKLGRDGHWEGELTHSCKDGRQLAVLSRWSLDADGSGKRKGILETNTDITARKRDVEALAESEERMRAIVEQATAGLARVDRTSRIVFVNQRLCQMVGYAESEIVGKRIRDFTHPADLKKSAKFFRELVNKGKAYETEKRYIRKDGSTLWVNVSASPVRDNRGKTRSAVAVIVDISARKQAEADLRRSHQMLEELVKQRTQALRNSNVELKNEITRRRGLEGQILEVSDREQQRLALELHDGLCQELTAIGFMARATALQLRHHRVLIPEDIDKIATMINNAAGNTRNISRALHRVDVDAAGFVNALQNLAAREIWKTPCRLKVAKSFQIDNEIAAIHLYGIAREAVINANKHARAREIVIALKRVKKEIVLTVSDNGLGLRKGRRKTPGMGFHIMDYRARSIGGRLEVQSRRGVGTRVSCYFPIQK
ncbi:MAG TPA: PAS domain S-box protein [Chthoniobacterales bacterium]|nr:PAS domain S-box protein [Chthoniobacterales bacterium]